MSYRCRMLGSAIAISTEHARTMAETESEDLKLQLPVIGHTADSESGNYLFD